MWGLLVYAGKSGSRASGLCCGESAECNYVLGEVEKVCIGMCSGGGGVKSCVYCDVAGA